MEDYHVWKSQVPITDITIYGHSRGSEKTGFYIPRFKIFLDAGIQSQYQPERIFISHCHTDHSFALPMLLTGITTKPKIYVPSASRDLFYNFVDATHQLSMNSKDTHTPHTIMGVSENSDPVDIGSGHSVRMYSLSHGDIPVNGYGIIFRKIKLNPKYAGLAGNAIAELRKTGKDITIPVEERVLAYLTDTDVSVFTKYPDLLSYKYVMCECTFIGDEMDDNKITGHTSWKKIKPIVLANPNTKFILIHFSIRYLAIQILEFFKNENISNVTAFVD